MVEIDPITQRFAALAPVLDERTRRLVAAAEAWAIGWGGAVAVSRATGVSRRAIRQGISELQSAPRPTTSRIRQPGGGRKKTVEKDPTLRDDLERVVEPLTRGDPASPLRWTCKSGRRLAAELNRRGHRTSAHLVADLLRDLGYRLQANRKARGGDSHPDRNAQFEQINCTVQEYLASGDPVIAVDTKKKEVVGDFKEGGRAWRPHGDPAGVRVHDVVIPEVGRANPSGVDAVAPNEGWISVGTDHDSAAFAVESIRRWWHSMGVAKYRQAQRLPIAADGAGSNGSRVRLGKVELQRLANETGLAIRVCHLPPGTRKWNKIEHRLFSFISQNWRGKPLIRHEVSVNLIAATTTPTGVRVRCDLDRSAYPPGQKVSDDALAQVNLQREDFHGEWNYTILPQQPSS
jgi:hypothetical protein